MSSSPDLLNPTDRARQRDEDAQYYRGILHRLIDMGTDLAEAIHRQATTQQSAAPTPEAAAPQQPQPDPSITFDRLARTIRRTIALARKLSEPSREAPGPKPHLTDRCAEGCIECCPSARQRRTDRAETDALHAEPCERPEELDSDADEDLDDALDDQSFADLIASLRHDSGLATLTDAQLWQRRTPPSAQERIPGETCRLCARAARPPRASAGPGSPGSGTTDHPGTGPPEP